MDFLDCGYWWTDLQSVQVGDEMPYDVYKKRKKATLEMPFVWEGHYPSIEQASGIQRILKGQGFRTRRKKVR